MTNKIFKFPLITSLYNIFSLPLDAKYLMVHKYQGQPILWVLGNPLLPTTQRKFAVFGAEHDIPDKAVYCGMFLTNNDTLVWHVFEVPN